MLKQTKHNRNRTVQYYDEKKKNTGIILFSGRVEGWHRSRVARGYSMICKSGMSLKPCVKIC